MLNALMPFARRSERAVTGEPFGSLQREINRLFDDAFRGNFSAPAAGKLFLMPSLDVKETDKTIEVEAELPGVDEKDVQVTFEDGVLTLKGEKKEEKDEKKAGYHVSEPSYGAFQRQLEFADNVDAEKIAANFTKGVLKVTLPKLPEAQARSKKIEIKVAK